MLSGALCDVFQAIIDYFVYVMYTFEYERATVCWTISYTLSIVLRHISHRYIVFGEYEGTYCASLIRTYATYSSSIIISIITNHIITNYYGVSHRNAWIITMIWTGVYNYFVLKKSWGSKSKEEDSSSGGSGGGNGDDDGVPLIPLQNSPNHNV